MTVPDDLIKPEALAADHAGSVLCRLLMAHPQVIDIEIVGQAELSDGVITYSLGVMLPAGVSLICEVIERRQDQEHCASITRMIRHYVARTQRARSSVPPWPPRDRTQHPRNTRPTPDGHCGRLVQTPTSEVGVGYLDLQRHAE